MITYLRSLIQLLNFTSHSRHAMKPSTIRLLVIMLLISMTYSLLIGAETGVALAQDEPCADVVGPSSDSLDVFYELTDTIKENVIKEQIDIFLYSMYSQPYIPDDIEALNVHMGKEKDSACAPLNSDFYCYKLVVDRVLDTGEPQPQEHGTGGMYVEPEKIFEAVRKNGVWRLEDNDNTFIIVEPDDMVTLKTYVEEVPDRVYDDLVYSAATEVDIPSSGMISFMLSITDFDGNPKPGASRKYRGYVEDNSIYTVDVDSSGKPTLRKVSCGADGEWR